jgi:hypothetical protein
MPFTPAIGVEPIPGYQLVERRGFGGYGEVWKVTAPGGLFKAMKIIYGDLSGPRAEQELKSLGRIKSVRYPFLLSLERFEVVDGQLLIVTELADCSLKDRYQECLNAGMPGIPREELLGYLRDTADALDYMNETHGLQHLDIKPENLLLLGGRIKVGDFGLVKELLGTSTHITGGVTPIYAPPEAFDGKASRHSDQYSLAIVYQEMLTGQRPFPGTTAFQLAAQHTSAPPMLGPLPLHDRDAIARALAKISEQRFSSCRELIDTLVAAASRPKPPPPRQMSREVLGLATVVDSEPLLAPTPKQTLVSQLPVSDLAESDIGDAPTQPGGASGLRPTLFLGIGGLAGLALQRLRWRLHGEFGDLRRLPIFRFLLLDTDRASLRQARQGAEGRALGPDEVLHCPLFPPEHYRDQSRSLLTWLDRRWLYGIPRTLQTEGLRPLGRLALVDHASSFLTALQQALLQVASPEARSAAVGFIGRGLRNETPRIFVVASLGGGTGGGMLVDVAYAVRQVLGELGVASSDVCAVLVHAFGSQPAEKTRARVNAHATLRELQHWSRRDTAFPGSPEQGLKAFGPDQAPFNDCYLLFQPEATGPEGLEILIEQLAEYLLFDATRGGGHLDRLRLRSSAAPGTITVRSCGLSSLRFPREQLIDWTSQVLCRHLVECWRGEIPGSARARLEQQAREMVRDRNPSEERLQERFHERLADLLGQSAEELFTQLAAAGGSEEAETGGSNVNLAALLRIEEKLGTGDEPDAGTPAPTPLEVAFQREAKGISREITSGLIDWLLEKVEEPGIRLRAAEVALAVIVQQLLPEVQKAREGRAELRTARMSQRKRMLGQESGGGVSGFFSARLRRFRSASGADRHLWGYFCLRLEELIAESVLSILMAIQSRLTAWGLELTQARRKLTEMLAVFTVPDLGEPQGPGHSVCLELFPGQAKHLGAAVTALLAGLPEDLLRQIDRRFQAEVLDSGGGLWAMLTGNVNVARLTQSRSPASVAFWNLVGGEAGISQELREALMKRASLLVGAALKGVDLTSLLLERYGEPEQLQRVILERVKTAQLLGRPDGAWQHLLVVVPDQPAAAELRESLLEALTAVPVAGTVTGVPVTLVDAGDDLLVAWETAGLSLPELAQQMAADDPDISNLGLQLQTRRDIPWTDP